MTARDELGQERALLIGEVAKQAGVNVQTLRYYERRGLLAEPDRSPSGYRLYESEAVRIVRFIKRAQHLGFSLSEIERLLSLRDDSVGSCEQVQELAEAKLDTIAAKVRDLQRLRSALDVLVESCQRGDADRYCPILEAIEDEASAQA